MPWSSRSAAPAFGTDQAALCGSRRKTARSRSVPPGASRRDAFTEPTHSSASSRSGPRAFSLAPRAARGVLVHQISPGSIRLVTHKDVSRDDILAALAAARTVLAP